MSSSTKNLNNKNILEAYFNYSSLNQKELFKSRSELIDNINKILC